MYEEHHCEKLFSTDKKPDTRAEKLTIDHSLVLLLLCLVSHQGGTFIMNILNIYLFTEKKFNTNYLLYNKILKIKEFTLCCFDTFQLS